jgi:hypothetical protein
MLSTIHDNGITHKQVRDKKEATGFRNVTKPDCVIEYNKYMGGVDLMDQYLQYYEYPHRSHKWYMPLYHRILETAIINGYILYQKVHNDKKMTHLKFREDLIEGLLNGITPTQKAVRATKWCQQRYPLGGTALRLDPHQKLQTKLHCVFLSSGKACANQQWMQRV